MGGLAVRRWLAEAGPAGDARVHRVVTIGTPHRGTWLARLALSMNTREMRIDSPWQRLLGEREPAERPAKFTCFYSHCDNIVFPPATATLPGADNRHLPGVAHVDMVDHPAPWLEVQRLAVPACQTVNCSSPGSTTPASISPESRNRLAHAGVDRREVGRGGVEELPERIDDEVGGLVGVDAVAAAHQALQVEGHALRLGAG